MDTSTTSSVKPQGADPAARSTDATSTGTTTKVSPRKQWDRSMPHPEGRAYTPFYGRRGSSYCEKESDIRGLRLNWVCPYPQDKALHMDDFAAAHSIEEVLSKLAQQLGFAYVWIIHGPRSTTTTTQREHGGSGEEEEKTKTKTEWSVGACFGSDEKTRMVYGHVYVNVNEDNTDEDDKNNNQVVVTGLMEEGTRAAPSDGRVLDLWVADDGEIGRPFAAKKEKKKSSNNGGHAAQVLKPSKKLADRITKPKSKKSKKPSRRAPMKTNGEGR